MGCSPNVQKASPTEFLLVNPAKQSNFIIGELVSGGQLEFIVENLPKLKPQTGCPGAWMFDQMMTHFGTAVTAVQGNWVGPASDNLTKINQLTAGGAMTVEDAAKQTWTGIQANRWSFTRVQLAVAPAGAPGNYTRVCVLYTK